MSKSGFPLVQYRNAAVVNAVNMSGKINNNR